MFSIVILSKNPDNCMSAVMAIYMNEPDIPRQNIIVVDDGAKKKAFPNCPNITWLDGVKPFIFARNANVGLRHAFESGSDAVILLNDDAVLSIKRGFSDLYAAAGRDPSYGLVASSTNNVGNTNQHPRGDKHMRREKERLCFVCVLISRMAWEKVGPLDEQFIGYGFDDDDYSRRVLSAGFRLGVWDGCFVDHGSLPSTFRGNGYPNEGYAFNEALFKAKYAHGG
jgi:GT2 family glycosyltransferase